MASGIDLRAIVSPSIFYTIERLEYALIVILLFICKLVVALHGLRFLGERFSAQMEGK